MLGIKLRLLITISVKEDLSKTTQLSLALTSSKLGDKQPGLMRKLYVLEG
jgi:hypothetical protein